MNFDMQNFKNICEKENIIAKSVAQIIVAICIQKQENILEQMAARKLETGQAYTWKAEEDMIDLCDRIITDLQVEYDLPDIDLNELEFVNGMYMYPGPVAEILKS